jgi:hypothetical protein
LAQGRALETKQVSSQNLIAQEREFASAGQGLFYTVQVGVYNKPLLSESQLGLTELIEARTQNGQYRYASGKFDNLVSAKVRQKEAVAKGIKDAFIVAYYQGKRIDLAQARLLSQSGTPFDVRLPEPNNLVVSTTVQQEIQALKIPLIQTLVPPDPVLYYEKKCDECSTELARYNRVGVFVYDEEKELLMSAQQKKSMWNLQQLMYLQEMRQKNPKGIKFNFQIQLDSPLNGAYVDWLLRQNAPYSVNLDNQGNYIIHCVDPK